VGTVAVAARLPGARRTKARAALDARRNLRCAARSRKRRGRRGRITDAMADHDFDLLILGAGSAGVRCARASAALGARVAVVEADRAGGTCVNVGCVPKKLMVYASSFAEEMDFARGFGWTVGARAHDWSALKAARDAEVARLNGVYERLLRGAGVALLRGRARVTG